MVDDSFLLNLTCFHNCIPFNYYFHWVVTELSNNFVLIGMMTLLGTVNAQGMIASDFPDIDGPEKKGKRSFQH